MDTHHDLRLREIEDVVVPLQIKRVFFETLSPKSLFVQALVLNHGSGGAVQEEDPLAERPRQQFGPLIERHSDLSESIGRVHHVFVSVLFGLARRPHPNGEGSAGK